MICFQPKLKAALAGAIAGLLLAVTAAAQGPVMVIINPEVGNLIALDLDVDISQIPVTVQAPIAIAANVCGVAVNVLAQEIDQGTAECEAETTSEAFNRIVQGAIQ
jgi:hypothetical protein